MNRKNIHLFLSIIIYFILSNLTAFTQSRKADRYGFVFKNNSFVVRSTITELNPNFPTKTVYLSERYSSDQRRAKISYYVKNGIQDTRWFFHDSETGASVLFDHKSGLCSRTTIDELYFVLFSGDSSDNMLALLASMDKEDASFKYVIGPVKLLQLIFAKVDSLRIISYPEMEDPSSIRNHETIEYILNFKFETNPVQIRIFYDKTTFSVDKIQETVPLQAIFRSSHSGTDLVIDYYEHEVLDQSTFLNEIGMDEDSKVLIDEFAFPVSLGCSKALESQLEKQDVFNTYDLNSLRFSFEANSELFGTMEQTSAEHFVAFDGIIQSMRIDDQQKVIDGKYSVTTSIMDFRAGRMYNMMDNVDNCFVIQTFQAVTRGETRTFSKIILGTDEKLIYLGLAKVRGMIAQVFELHSERLPYWFSNPKPVRLPNGEYVGCFLDSCVASSSRSINQYRIVVYLDQKEDNGFKLLLVEVYDRNRISNKLFFRAHIYDFQFALKDAPNGDLGIELFSIKDNCNSQIATNRYAEVDLLLESEREDDLALDWVQQWTSRDISLFSGLKDALNLATSSIYGFQSRISASEAGQNMITATFRVAEHPMYFRVINFIRYTDYTGSKYGLVTLKAQSPVECFLQLDQMKFDVPEPIYLYFNSLSRTCIFNKDLTSKNSTGLSVNLADLTYIFTPADLSAGGIFKIEPIEDIGMGVSTYWLKAERFENIANRKVLAQLVNSLDPKKPIKEVLMLRVRKAVIKSVDNVNRVGDNEKKDVKLAKVGLTISGGTRRFEGAESLNECEAACLANLECRLYSFCVRQAETECLLSNLSIPFRNFVQIANTSHSRKFKRKFAIKTDTASELELIDDFRCELRSKLYLKLFNSRFPVIQPLQNQDIIPVEFREECAEICFARSLAAIRSSVSMSSMQTEPEQLEIKGSFCTSFKYMDTALNQKQQKIIESLVGNRTYNSRFCVLEKPSETHFANYGTRSAFEDEYFTLESYKFDFSNLYEKKHGYILRESSLELEERKALDAINQDTEKSRNEKHYEILKRRLLNSNGAENFQFTFASDISNCADKCFMQTSPLWPACRSFDYSSSFSEWSGNLALSICTLNTASLAFLNKTQQKELLLEAPIQQGIKTIHYEPRFGLAIEEVEAAYFFKLAGEIKSESRVAKSSSYGSVMIISLLAIVTGLIAGILLVGRKRTELDIMVRRLIT